MPEKVYIVRNALNAGEVSPLVSFRSDVDKYQSACLTLENAVPLVEGGAKKMPGSYYAGATLNNSKARLVPFQFSTIQGAILEFTAGVVRVWEAASNGVWSLGLAQQTPTGISYNPSTAYTAGNLVSLGPFTIFHTATLGSLTIAAPYGQNNFNTVPITITIDSTAPYDSLIATVTGTSPNQGINIALATFTASNNAASTIQTAIRNLVSLNIPTNNYVDLSAWTVTPDPIYYATPWTSASGITSISIYQRPVHWSTANAIFQCVTSNQNDQFPWLYLARYGTLNSTYWKEYTGTLSTIEVNTPYAEADLFDLDCSTQSADVLWIFHPEYPPACIERLGANDWQYSLSLPGQEPGEAPYRGTTDVVTTGYSAIGQCISAITQATPCVISIASMNPNVFNNGDRIYINEVAGMVELNEGEYIVSGTSITGVFSFNIQDPDTGVTITSSGYQKYTGGGFAVKVVPMFAANGDYPACGTLYQERLCVGGSDNNPVQMNGSTQDDYPEFICDPNADDHAIQFKLVSNKVDQIVSMIGTPNALLLGTAGGVWVMTGSNGGALTQVSVNAAKQTALPISSLQPQLTGDSSIFVSGSNRIVIFLIYDFVSNQWNNFDLTRLNKGITLGTSESTSGLAQTAWQNQPYPIFWAVRNDGQLIGLVFNKQDQVYAWYRVNMQVQGGNIESVAVISGDNQEDQVAVVVNRTINGATVRYVEYFMPQEMFGQLSNAFFVNCGQQLQLLPATVITGITNATTAVVTSPAHGLSNGMTVQITGVQGMTQVNQDKTQAYTVTVVDPNTFQLQGVDSTLWGVYTSGGTVMQVANQVTGMAYLMGQTIVAVGDGAKILDSTVVTADTVIFPYYCNLITIGLPYQVTIQPTNPVLSSQSSTTKGMQQKLDRVTISLYQSMGGQYGTDLSHMYDIGYGPGTMGQQPQMSTTEVTKDLDSDWNESASIYVTQNDPFPFTLRGLVMRMSYNPD